jgi:hypothetical protein
LAILGLVLTGEMGSEHGLFPCKDFVHDKFALADPRKLLTPHVPLGKSRLETLCLLVLSMISASIVNLTHIVAERPSRAKVASTYRRLERFLQQGTSIK